MKNIAFLFSGDIESPANLALLAVIDSLDKSLYTPFVFVQNSQGAFAHRLAHFKINLLPLKTASVNPTCGRAKGIWQTFKQCPRVFHLLNAHHIHAVICAEMALLLTFAPGTFALHVPLIWLQESLWEKYPIAELWSGYTKHFIAADSEIYASIPSPAQFYTKVVKTPDFEKALKNRALSKNYFESLFKDCI